MTAEVDIVSVDRLTILMPNLMTLMLGIIGVSVALLAGLIITQSATVEQRAPGSPCVYEKGRLDSIVIAGFEHDFTDRQTGFFQGHNFTISQRCLPASTNPNSELIEDLTIDEMQFESENAANRGIDEFIELFGNRTTVEVLEQDIQVITERDVGFLMFLWRHDTTVFNISINAYQDIELTDEQLLLLETEGLKIVDTILGDL